MTQLHPAERQALAILRAADRTAVVSRCVHCRAVFDVGMHAGGAIALVLVDGLCPVCADVTGAAAQREIGGLR